MFGVFTEVFEVCYVSTNNKITTMNSGVPLLNYDQISELKNLIYNIQDENKTKLDEILSEQTQPENTSVLSMTQ